MRARPESAQAQLKIRVREDVRQKLEDSSRENEWPLNKEITKRLETSLREDERLGGSRTAAFLRLIAAYIETIEQETGRDWLSDPVTFSAVREVVASLMDRRRPTGTEADAQLETIVEQMLTSKQEEASALKEPDRERAHAIAVSQLKDYNDQIVLGPIDREE